MGRSNFLAHVASQRHLHKETGNHLYVAVNGFTSTLLLTNFRFCCGNDLTGLNIYDKLYQRYIYISYSIIHKKTSQISCFVLITDDTVYLGKISDPVIKIHCWPNTAILKV